jgi:N-acetylglutamate synthase-like GNAT family acetyltransferase
VVISSLFGSRLHIRDMQPGDLDTVLGIIAHYDEDDAEEAREDFRDGLDGMFVLTDKVTVVGVTGATADPQADAIAWLSWTYIAADKQGQGLGRHLIGGLVAGLQDDGVRKLFISASDETYQGRDLYADTRAFYEAIGARLEVILPNYHAPGITRFIYGLDLIPPFERTQRPGGALRFVDIEPAPESDGGYSLVWEADTSTTPPPRVDPCLDAMIARARTTRARLLVAAVPSDLCVNIGPPLQAAGFHHLGRLLDYFEPNIHLELGILRIS